MKTWKTPTFSERNSQREEAKQIMLDKMAKNVYNTLKGVEGKESYFPLDTPPMDFTLNQAQSERTFEMLLSTLGDAQNACIKEGFPLPVLSGGAIRDAMLGVVPNDYDIFVDVTDVGDEELDDQDRFLLLADAMFPEADGWRYRRINDQSYAAMPNHFSIYEGTRENVTVQIIGRTDSRLSSETPLDFTAEYPYNIIKNVACEGGFFISASAMKGFEKKVIVPTDKDRHQRKAEEFFYRHYDLIVNGWKLVSPPQRKPSFFSKTGISKETVNQFMNPAAEIVFEPRPALQQGDWVDAEVRLLGNGIRRGAQMQAPGEWFAQPMGAAGIEPFRRWINQAPPMLEDNPNEDDVEEAWLEMDDNDPEERDPF